MGRKRLRHTMDRRKSYSELQQREVREYVRIVENVLGIILPDKAEVHHVNEDFHDNRNENLVVCEDRYYHRLLHLRRKALLACGNAKARRCPKCGEWDTIDNPDFRLYARTNRANGFNAIHRSCYNEYRNKRKEVKRRQNNVIGQSGESEQTITIN